VRPDARGDAEAGKPSLPAYLATATLVLSVFSGHFDMLPGSPPLNRLALGALVIAAVPRLIAGRFSFRAVHLLLGLEAVWALGSAIWVGTVGDSLHFFALLDEVLVPAVLVVLAPVAYATRADRRLLLRSITLLGLYIGLVSVPQALGKTQFLFPRYLAAGAVPGEITRAGGPFLQAAGNGAALAMCLPVALLLMRCSRGWWRIAAVLSAGACAVGGLLTFTRSVWLACLAAFVVFMLLDPWLRKKLPALLMGAGVATASLLALVPSLYAQVADRFGTERSIDDRTTTNAAALAMLHDHPIAGIGWGRFLDVVDDYVRQQDLIPLTATHIIAHNIVLSRAAELGAVGALVFVLALIAGPLRASLSRNHSDLPGWRHGLLAMLAAWMFVAMLTPMGYPFPNYLLWIVTGLVMQSWRHRGQARSGQTAAHAAPPGGSAGEGVLAGHAWSD
jgi:putative inorganic carbon (HCO3(-)) transporter